MLNKINQKFNFFAVMLILLLGLGYGILTFFLRDQQENSSRTQDVVLIERKVDRLMGLFHELRFWEGAIFTQKQSDADRNFGRTLENFRNILKELKTENLDSYLSNKLEAIESSLDKYEFDFNTISQMKTEQRFIATRMATSYKSIASNVLTSRNSMHLKPLFNLSQFLNSYRIDHRESEFKALLLVTDYLEKSIHKKNRQDGRMKGYLEDFRSLLRKHYQIEEDIRSLNTTFKNVNLRLMNELSAINTASEMILIHSFDESNILRKRFDRIYFLTIISSIIILLLILTLIARTIVRPVKDISRVTKEIEDNNISARFKPIGRKGDEIIELGISINHMLDTIESNNQKLLIYQNQLEIKISELADSENELRKHRENLEFLVEERTNELSKANVDLQQEIAERKKSEQERRHLENQLQQAQKMESIGTMAGGIAHDFNNLLMGVQGRISLMLIDTDVSHPHFEHLKGVEEYVKSAADLTKQLLGFARGGKYEVRALDLNELIAKQNSMFGRTRKEINIQEKFEANLWTVECDQGQIGQVLLNIYTNAWQAMPDGGDLYIQTENTTIDENLTKPYHMARGKYVKVSVTDTGIGMDKATQQKIFDPFFTTKEMGRGTGLGLASVYGIIKNHGGFVDVYSSKGEGTIFNIYLPASDKKAIRKNDLAKSIFEGTETVLLVDDEDIVIDVGKSMLEKMGYTVLIARRGREAIEFYKQNQKKVDMVILDMIMPEMGGGKTYDRLTKINPDIKVLLSSGYSIDGEAAKILERGCDGFIQKPFNLNNLSKKIREIFDKG